MFHPVAHFAYILFYYQSLSKNLFHNNKKKSQLTKAFQNMLYLLFIQVNGKGDSQFSTNKHFNSALWNLGLQIPLNHGQDNILAQSYTFRNNF